MKQTYWSIPMSKTLDGVLVSPIKIMLSLCMPTYHGKHSAICELAASSSWRYRRDNIAIAAAKSNNALQENIVNTAHF
jgi:hypothetical protein